MKFWKGNRISQEFELSHKEVLEKFKESKFFKLIGEQNFDRTLTQFLTSKVGLYSTFEKEDYDKLADYICKELNK